MACNSLPKFDSMTGGRSLYLTVSDIRLLVLSKNLRPYSCMKLLVFFNVLRFKLDDLRKAATRVVRHFDRCIVAVGYVDRKFNLDHIRVCNQMTTKTEGGTECVIL